MGTLRTCTRIWVQWSRGLMAGGILMGPGLVTAAEPGSSGYTTPGLEFAVPGVLQQRPEAPAVIEPQIHTATYGQSTRVTLVARNEPIARVLEKIAKQAELPLLWSRDQVPLKGNVSVSLTEIPVMEALATILRETGAEARLSSDGKTIVIVRKSVPTTVDRQGTATLTGTVSDSTTRRGIPGVTVTVVGTKVSAVTNEQGVFRLSEVPAGEQSLSVRMLGYESRIVKVTVEAGKPASVVVTLHQTSTTLSEVVTTATGQQRRVEVANDIAKINADSLLRIAPARSVSELLAVARIPGVVVTPSSGLPGSPSRIRLRGVGSMSRSNDPVVIVDGVWINAATSTDAIVNQAGAMESDGNPSSSVGGAVSSRLDDIDPNSIETIEVLRGPSAASLYGTDAANGVIIITTKRGKTGKTRWSLTTDHSWNKTPGQYQRAYRGFGYSPLVGNMLDTDCFLEEVESFLCVIDSVSSLNPRNRALLTNETSGGDAAYSASVSGGTPSVQYFLGVNREELLGPLTLPRVDRIRFRQLGESVPGWLKRPNRQTQSSLTTRLTMQPMPALQFDLMLMATQNDQTNGTAEFVSSTATNFLPEDTLFYAQQGALQNRERLTSRTTSGKIALVTDWRPWSWMMPNLTVGLDRNNRNDDRISTRRSCLITGCDLPQAVLGVFQGEQSMYTANLRAAFPVSLGHWERFLSLKPSLGANLRRSLSSGLTVTGDSLALGSEDIGTAILTSAEPRLNDNSATGGWYTDVQIGIWQRFYTTVGFRQDIGSALSTRIQAPTYPKLGTSWLVSDEGFFPKNEIVKTLRLRMAYGHSAIQPDISSVRGGYYNTQVLVNGQIVNGIYAANLGNSELRPERAVELEYGFEAGLLGDRTQLSVTVSTKRNRDQLVVRELGYSTGGNLGSSSGGYIAATPGKFTENISRVLNRSVEMSLESRLIERAGMVWSVNLSGSTEFNRVEKIGDQVLPFGDDAARIVEGYPLNSVWAYPVVSYNDVDGDGVLQSNEIVIGDTLAYIGWPQPRYMLNYGTTLQLFNGRLNLTSNLAYDGQLTQNQRQYDGWGAVDPTSPLSEQALAHLNRGDRSRIGNRQIISVLRFTGASASILLPERWARQLRATAASLSLQGSNLGLWSHYRGRDPGVNSSPRGERLTDNGTTIPQPRKYAVSLRLNF